MMTAIVMVIALMCPPVIKVIYFHCKHIDFHSRTGCLEPGRADPEALRGPPSAYLALLAPIPVQHPVCIRLVLCSLHSLHSTHSAQSTQCTRSMLSIHPAHSVRSTHAMHSTRSKHSARLHFQCSGLIVSALRMQCILGTSKFRDLLE